jgi:hypothetical protein
MGSRIKQCWINGAATGGIDDKSKYCENRQKSRIPTEIDPGFF